MELRKLVQVDTSSPMPVYAQIEEQVERMILGGRFDPGERVPSVRELAMALRVNPLTVSKAYSRLADRGIVVTMKGKGVFVPEEPPSLSKRERESILAEKLDRLVDEAKRIGTTRDELADFVRRKMGL